MAQLVLDSKYFLLNSCWEYLREARLKLCITISCWPNTQLKVYWRKWVIRFRLVLRFIYVETWLLLGQLAVFRTYTLSNSGVRLHTSRIHG